MSVLPNPTRDVSAELLEAICSEADTLAACILITPAVGDPVGFTSHDDDVEFDGVTYYADPGVSPTEMAAVISYAVDNLEIFGAFDEDLIKRADVRGGIYDGAEYTIFVIDQENPGYGDVVVQRGELGETGIDDDRFTFELRSLSQKLQRSVGELTGPDCRADIFDARCKLDEDGNHPTLAIPYKYAGRAVTEVVSRFTFKFTITSHTVPAGYLEGGLLVWESGVNVGQRSEVKTHTVSGSVHTVTLQEPAARAFSEGDTLRVRKGCKKTADACQDVGNMKNKRSEDYLPGTLELLRRAG